ncbi:MAG: response regulator [Candidatus Omnitrophica bacterium]|nr:response regulator [Candidatus Omnitrophota bacterium]
MSKVLLVEDEQRFIKYIQQYLERLGNDVTIAETGEAAINLFSEQNPEIVILDLGLPDIDGEVVLAKIREISGDVPIVVLTGNTDPGIKERVMSLGATEYFQKPYPLADLADWIAIAREGRTA